MASTAHMVQPLFLSHAAKGSVLKNLSQSSIDSYSDGASDESQSPMRAARTPSREIPDMIQYVRESSGKAAEEWDDSSDDDDVQPAVQLVRAEP
eukprot:4444728-Prymnesium_polylepis.1